MLASTKGLLQDKVPLPAFNFSTPEICQAIVETCHEMQQPAILMMSQSEMEFLGLEMGDDIATYYANKYETPFSLQLDHQTDITVIEELSSLRTNVSSIMLDVEPLPYEDGVALLKKAKQELPSGIILEGNLSDYAKASEFIAETGIDILAPEKGNSVDTSVLVSLAKEIVIPLAMHGGSSKDEEDIKKLVRAGVKKFNFNTELRTAWSLSLRKVLNEHPDEIKPYKIILPTIETVAGVVRQKIQWIKGDINTS